MADNNEARFLYAAAVQAENHGVWIIDNAQRAKAQLSQYGVHEHSNGNREPLTDYAIEKLNSVKNDAERLIASIDRHLNAFKNGLENG